MPAAPQGAPLVRAWLCVHTRLGAVSGSGALCGDGVGPSKGPAAAREPALSACSRCAKFRKGSSSSSSSHSISSAGRGGGCGHTAESQGSRAKPGVGCVWGTCHLRALRVSLARSLTCWGLAAGTALCSFCDLSVFSAVVFWISSCFVWCQKPLAFLVHKPGSSQFLFLPVSSCSLSWLCSGGAPQP